MKLDVVFKSPDAVYEGLAELADDDIDKIVDMKNVILSFVKYGEYVTIRFDTETGTAEVLPTDR